MGITSGLRRFEYYQAADEVTDENGSYAVVSVFLCRMQFASGRDAVGKREKFLL